jgi:hypothetical protein
MSDNSHRPEDARAVIDERRRQADHAHSVGDARAAKTATHRRTRRAGFVGATLVLAVLSLLLSPAADAATWGWSPYIPPNTMQFHYCTVKAGPVKDPYGSLSSYGSFGGAQITNCSTPSSFQIWVQEQYSPNYNPSTGAGTWYNIGSQGVSRYYSNYWSSDLIVTGRTCSQYGVYWRTAVDVYVYNYGSGAYSGWHHSDPQYSANATLC